MAGHRRRASAKRTAERLRLSKALPEAIETPGVVVQLQRLADRANVELTSIKTNTFSDYGVDPRHGVRGPGHRPLLRRRRLPATGSTARWR